MSEQPEFLKTVRTTVEGMQSKATERLEAWNRDARRTFDGLVEKGRSSQRDLAGRLQKAAEKVQANELSRKVKEAQERAVILVNTTSRDRAHDVAENLRRVATRIDEFVQRPAARPPAAEVH
jgi:predicted transcriptional regulator